ncbi:MAG: hypothetical protein WAL64_04030 [Candidatus Dormiibacterota bacterium]
MTGQGGGDADTGFLLGLGAAIAAVAMLVDLTAKRSREEHDRLIRDSRASPGYAWERVGDDLRRAMDGHNAALREAVARQRIALPRATERREVASRR